MTAANFNPLVQQLLQIEGGISDRPLKDDPGGLTSLGVTQKVYDQWRTLRSLPPKSVREIISQEAVAIAKANYWNPVQGDKLPSGVDFAVFDFAYNSGCAQAVKELQRTLGVTADGVVGLGTLEALAVADPAAVINGVCDRRLVFMKRLKNWNANKNGWTRRVAHVRAQSLALASGWKTEEPDVNLTSLPLAKAPPPTPVPAKKSGGVWGAILAPFLLGIGWVKEVLLQAPDFIRQAIASVSPFAEKSELAQMILNGLGAAGAVVGIYVAYAMIQAKKAAS